MANSYMISFFLLLTCFRNTYAKPPPVFIFGDSTSDVGTNIHVPGSFITAANHPPFGIDFNNSEATGRFSNGFTIIDYLCKSMGYQRSPAPYLSYEDKTSFPAEMFDGVNFASAGSGLLNSTGEDFNIVSMPEQLNQFSIVRNNLKNLIGDGRADDFFAKSIFIISVGTNDMEYSYARGRIAPDPAIFSNEVILAYKNAIEVLYGLGARNFGFISALPVGCTPSFRVQGSTGGCLYVLNQIALRFYNNLNALAKTFESDLTDFKYSLLNTYRMLMNVMDHSPRSGFVNVDTACCGSGRFNAEVYCSSTTNLCENRDEYVFWDFIHPTDAAAKLIALTLYDGGLQFVSPITVRRLVEEIGSA